MGESLDIEMVLGGGLAYCVEYRRRSMRASPKYYPTDETRTIIKRLFSCRNVLSIQGFSRNRYERFSYAHTPFLSKMVLRVNFIARCTLFIH
jgi:hypothetical protein